MNRQEISEKTGFDCGEKWATDAEVRDYFRRGTLCELVGDRKTQNDIPEQDELDEMAATAMGMTTRELNKFVKEGNLLSDEFLPNIKIMLQAIQYARPPLEYLSNCIVNGKDHQEIIHQAKHWLHITALYPFLWKSSFSFPDQNDIPEQDELDEMAELVVANRWHMQQTWDERAEELGRGAMESITEMVAALECDYDRLEELADMTDADREELAEVLAAAGGCTSEEEARERIMEDPLSVQVRSGWVTPGEKMEPEEFEILLGTGGPAVRIIGELDGNQVKRPRLQVQNWGKPWTEYVPADKETLRKYCNVFYFGE